MPSFKKSLSYGSTTAVEQQLQLLTLLPLLLPLLPLLPPTLYVAILSYSFEDLC